MAKMYECDKCKVICQDNYLTQTNMIQDVDINGRKDNVYTRSVDLCKMCTEAYLKWLGKKEITD